MNERTLLRNAVALVSALGLGAGGLLFGLALLFVTVGVLIVGFGVELGPVQQLILSLFFIQGVGCVGVSVAYIRIRPALGPEIREILGFEPGETPFDIGARLPSLRDVGVMLGGWFVALLGVFVGAFLVSQLQVETGRNQVADIAFNNPGIILYLIPVMLFVVGPSEELLFRGVVQGRLREAFGPVPAILTASAAFAGMHGIALVGGSTVGNLLVLTLLLSPALVLGVSYEYTKNIVVPAVIHGVYNSTLVALMYVSVAYGDQVSEAQSAVLAAL